MDILQVKNLRKNFGKFTAVDGISFNLNINSLNHGAMTGRMLEGIEEILLKEK